MNYKVGDYVQVVNPFGGYEHYTGRRGMVEKISTNLIGENSLEITFDGDSTLDNHYWYDEEVVLVCQADNISETPIASEDELIDLLG